MSHRDGKVYLDHNATSPMRPEAMEAMVLALQRVGNASSVHACGRSARALVEDGRREVALLAGCGPDRLVFTGGGTEANALAIRGAVATDRVERLIVGATEHDAVLQNARASGLPVEVWPVDGDGVADLDWLRDRVSGWSVSDGRPLVALMMANNETGVIQPVAEAAALVRTVDGLLHVDAVQAAGKVTLDLEALGADTLAVSAHKIGGPQGVGALIYGARARLEPMIRGGGQERGLRAGTENMAGVAGFAAAVAAARRDLGASAAQALWRDRAAERLAHDGAVIVGERARRLPATLCLAVPKWSSALQVMGLDLEGVMVGSGSACSSGKVRPSGVIEAMGLAALAESAIRASGGWDTTQTDWDRFADVWSRLHARHAARTRTREFA